MAIIERAATAPEFDLTRIEKLLELKERWDAAEAKKAFTAAMADFKANPPKIYKEKRTDFTGKTGVRTQYDYASHSEIVEKIAAGLGAHGMSHRWTVAQDKGTITVTCVITHNQGHSESVSMFAMADDTGNKNAIQSIQSTVTYLQKYTILAATGLTAADMPDTDERKEYERPELPTDVKVALEMAARGGSEVLQKVFKELSQETRARIVADYQDEWTRLKAEAAAVKHAAP